MPEIGMSGSMSGDEKRSVAAWPKLPRPSSHSTLALFVAARTDACSILRQLSEHSGSK